jgi:fatty-acyl-CoA synthase
MDGLRTGIPSTMQDFPLTLTSILRHAVSVHPDSECVTWTGDPATTRRAAYSEIAANAARLANALARLGAQAGDRVATLCWNHQEHLEAYFAVPCMGGILHTLNLRLPADQLVFIANQAEDRFLIVDADLLPLLSSFAGRLSTVEGVIVVGPSDLADLGGIPVHSYQALLAAEEPEHQWPDIEERSAAAMCYTSGTTGDPKGVVYSHRSCYLQAMVGLAKATLGSNESDRLLPIVPMFHVNAWGIPHGALLSGASMLMPGRYLQPDQLTAFIAQERATGLAGVPTVLNWILGYGEKTDIDLSSLRYILSGGAAAPRTMLEKFQTRYGIRVVQGWGMTETSPLCGVSIPPDEVEPGSDADIDWRMHSARVAPGVELRIVDSEGAALPHDGVAAGEIEVRGPWITGSYFVGVGVPDPSADRFHDGWLRTGDIATVDRRGYLRITDRLKDVIKSGGEWISSVELEDRLCSHPGVASAAVIGVPDPDWTERPLACVVREPGTGATPAELAEVLAGVLAKWQVPDQWCFLAELPLTSVGKFDKKVLRARYAAGELAIERV